MQELQAKLAQLKDERWEAMSDRNIPTKIWKELDEHIKVLEGQISQMVTAA